MSARVKAKETREKAIEFLAFEKTRKKWGKTTKAVSLTLKKKKKKKGEKRKRPFPPPQKKKKKTSINLRASRALPRSLPALAFALGKLAHDMDFVDSMASASAEAR